MSATVPAILISAGELSGDIIGAQIARAVLARVPSARLFGLGGTRMSEAGVAVTDPRGVGVVGVTEAVAVLPRAVRSLKDIRRRVVQDRPDVAVLIGNDLFNAYLGRWLRRRGIRTVAFSPPQVWIWQSVLGPLAAGLTRVLASFPEEARAYEEAGVPTTFVGHHLADALHEVTPRERADARRALALTDAGKVVALMPGSRAHEVKRLAPALFGSARELANNRRDVQIVVAAADGFEATLRAGLARHGCNGVVTGDSYTALRAADAAVCCSGTVTLEAALLGVPMTVVYRTSWTTYGAVQAALALGILPTGTMALPNLVVGRPIVRELKQAAVTPAAIAADTGALLDDPGRREAMRAALREVRSRIDGHGTMDRVASIVLADRAPVTR